MRKLYSSLVGRRVKQAPLFFLHAIFHWQVNFTMKLIHTVLDWQVNPALSLIPMFFAWLAEVSMKVVGQALSLILVYLDWLMKVSFSLGKQAPSLYLWAFRGFLYFFIEPAFWCLIKIWWLVCCIYSRIWWLVCWFCLERAASHKESR